MKVLIAADAEWVRNTIRGAFVGTGQSVIEVTKGQDVRKAVGEHSPDLVILDSQIANMGGVAVAYATAGGARAIAWTDFQQMIVMTAGLIAAFLSAVWLLPSHVSFAHAVSLADVAGRLNVITTNFDWNDRYNLWSGLVGGTRSSIRA